MRKISKYTVAGAIGLALAVQHGACQQQPYDQGKILYTNFCESCHQPTGEALRQLIPPLAEADYLVRHRDHLACIIRYGLEAPIVVNGVTYEQAMPGFKQLSDVEIANILNYIHHSWGNDNPYTTLQEVQTALDSCENLK